MAHSHSSEDDDSSSKAFSSSSRDESLAICVAKSPADTNTDPESPNTAQQSSDESASSDGVLVELPGNNDQDSRSLPGDPETGILVNIDGSVQEQQERDDLFLDASDHIGHGGGTPRLDESVAIVGDVVAPRRRRSREPDLEGNRAQLDATAAECRNFKEERDAFGREVAALRADLQGLIDQQFLKREVPAEHHRLLENRETEHAGPASPIPLHSMVKDCSNFVVHLKGILDERWNSEGAVLYSKDQEIEFLSAKILEDDVFRDVLMSCLGSVWGECSQSMREYKSLIERRLLSSLPVLDGTEAVPLEELFVDGISLIEKRIVLLVEKQNRLLIEIEQLGQFMREIMPGSLTAQQNGPVLVFHLVREELLGSKKKNDELEEKIRVLEEESLKMSEQITTLNKAKDEADSEMSKVKTELEQAESRFSASKEKLSIAVTKGKQLIQHRDSLKQALTDKTTEFDKCVYELQQKANALETMEASNEDLQKSLSVKTSELEKCLLELHDKSDTAEDLKKLLQERTSELEKCLQELQLKSDAFDNANTKAEELGQILAENKDQLENCLLGLQQKSRELETTVATAEELKQSLIEKSCKLDECVVNLKQNSDALGTAEANVQQLKQALSVKEIELEKSLLELQEKSDLMVSTLKEFNELKDIVISLQDLAAYRDKVLKEIEGITHDVDFPKEVYSLDIVDKFRWLVTKMHMSDDTLRENRRVREALHFAGVPQAIAPAKLDSQVDWLVASFTQSKEELSRLQSEVTHTSTLHDSEVSEALKEYDSLAESLLKEKKEKESLLIEYEDLKVKHEMLAEKLSLIVSGKESFIQFLNEICATSFDDQTTLNMDTILDKFTYLRKKLMTSLNDGKMLENMQSFLHVTHVERILFEKILEDNETNLRSLSNELGVASEEINAFRNEKESMQKEVERLEDRNSLLKDKLSMAVKKGKGLVQEREVFKLTLDERKTEIERLKEELQLQESKVCEYMEQIKFLSAYPEQLLKLEVDIASLKDQKEQNEHLLSERNDNLQKLVDLINNIVLHTDKVFESPVDKIYWIAGHISEIEDTKNYLAHELEKAQQDANLNSSRYAEALETLKSLEIKLEKKEKHMHDEINNIQFTRAKTEEMLEKAREECFTQANKLAVAYSTIKSLEDKLSLAEDRVFALVAEKNEVVSKSILEISALNKKIAECNEELGKTQSSSESQLTELLSELRQLEIFMKNEGLLLLMIEQFRKKSEGLRRIWTLIQDIHEKFRAKVDPYILSEVELVLSNLSSPTNFEDLTKIEIVHSEAILDDAGAVTSFKRIAEKIKKEARSLNDRFTDLSRHMDDHITFALQVLEASRDEFIHTLHLNESLKLNLKKLEEHNQAQESEISSTQIKALRLLSKCNNATEELQVKISELSGFDSCLENIQSGIDLRSSASFHGKAENEDVCEFDLAAENLLLTSRKVITQYQNLVNINKEMSISFENLKHELNHAKMTADSTFDENKVIKERILKLEGDMESLQNICNETKAKLNDYKSKEDAIKDTETKLESLDHSLTAKDREVGDEIISRGQVEVLLEKVDKLILMAGSSHHSESQGQEVYFTSSVNKLFYVVDKFSDFLQEVVSLADEKKDLQLIIAEHVREIENLKSFAECLTTEFQDLESKKWQLNEVTSILEKITQKLAEHYSFEDSKPVTAMGLIQVLERQMIALRLDLENSKSQIHELGGKLHAKDMLVNEMSSKVKYLEDSRARIQQPDIKERSVFESSAATMRPEITEIEEGSVGMSSKNPIASAHVRAMRKGSSEHLALTIDSEHEHLLTAQETDDKGHVFKSLNTSGLIPKQGRLIADRVDGIWVSGGRMLMSKPAARLGLVAYWIFLHLWVLVSIL